MMTAADLARLETLRAAGWVATDERFSTTGKLVMVGPLRDPVNGKLMSLASADAIQASRTPRPAPQPLPPQIPLALEQALRPILPMPVEERPAAESSTPSAVPPDASPVATEKPTAPWQRTQVRDAKESTPEFQSRIGAYEKKIAPLIAQLEVACADAGIGGVIVMELDENASESVALEITHVGAALRTDFSEMVLRGPED